MGKIDKNLIKALENTFGHEDTNDESLMRFFNAIPYLLEHYSDKELNNPMFMSFMAKVPDLIREYRFLEFLEDNKDCIEKYPGGEKIARRCLEEIFMERYKPGYIKAIDFLDTGQA